MAKFLGYTPGVAVSQASESLGQFKHEEKERQKKEAENAALVGQIMGNVMNLGLKAMDDFNTVQEDLLSDSGILDHQFEGMNVYESKTKGLFGTDDKFNILTKAQDRFKFTDEFEKKLLDPKFKERYYDAIHADGGALKENMDKFINAGLVDPEKDFGSYGEFKGHMTSMQDRWDKEKLESDTGITPDLAPPKSAMYDEITEQYAKGPEQIFEDADVIFDRENEAGEFAEVKPQVDKVEWTDPVSGKVKLVPQDVADAYQRRWDSYQEMLRLQEEEAADLILRGERGEEMMFADMDAETDAINEETMRIARQKEIKRKKDQVIRQRRNRRNIDDEGYSMDSTYMPSSIEEYESTGGHMSSVMPDEKEGTVFSRLIDRIKDRRAIRQEDRMWAEIDADDDIIAAAEFDVERSQKLKDQYAAWQDPQQRENAALLYGTDDYSYEQFQQYYDSTFETDALLSEVGTTTKFDHLGQQVLFDSIDPDISPLQGDNFQNFDNYDDYYDMLKGNLQNK